MNERCDRCRRAEKLFDYDLPIFFHSDQEIRLERFELCEACIAEAAKVDQKVHDCIAGTVFRFFANQES